MGVASKTQNQSSSPAAATLDSTRILGIIYAIVFGFVGLLLLGYALMALTWLQQPFPGAMFSRTLVVEDFETYTDSPWAAHEAGLLKGDTVIGSEGVEWAAADRYEQLQEMLGQRSVGDSIELIVTPADPAASSLPACLGGFETTQRCVNLTLQAFPGLDAALYFLPSFIAGILIYLIGAFVLWRRFEFPSAQLFGLGAAALSVALVGWTDVLSQQQLIPFWLAGTVAFAAFTVSFAFSFPYDLGVVRRVPNLRYAPLVAGALFYIFLLATFQNTLYDGLLVLAPLLMIIAVALLIGMMQWRRQYSSSPILREQTTFVALGAALGFGTLFLWLLIFVVGRGEALEFLTPVMQLSPLLYVLSTAYATLQYRLLETDRIIPDFIVYNILGALLLLGYLLLTAGLSLLSIDNLRADNPILVALVLGLVVLLFAPARNYLRRAIDRVMFRQRHNYQQRREDFARSISDARKLDSILAAVQQEFQETIAPTNIFLFTYDSRVKAYAAQPEAGKKQPSTDITFDPDSGLAAYLSQEQSVLYLEPGQPLPLMVVPDRSRLAVLNTPLLLRLQGQNRLNGILAVGARRSGDPYTYEDLRFVESITEQVAVAVERTQFVADLEHRVEIQDVLSQISTALNFAIDFDTLLELIYTQTTRIIDADHFFIVLRKPDSNELYYSFYNLGDERLYHLEGKGWQMGGDVLSEVARKQSPLVLESFSAEQQRRGQSSIAGVPDIHAWIGVPMLTDVAERGVLGVMAIGSSDPSVQFSQEQLGLFRNVASIAASAIDKTQLFQKTELRARQLKALNDVSSHLAAELEDLDRLLQIITENAVKILGCEAGSLLLVDDVSRDLVFRVVTGGGGQDLIGTHIPQDSPSLVASAVQRIEPIIVNNPEEDTRWHGELVNEADTDNDGIPDHSFHSRALLTVPLVAHGQAIGALQVINKKDGTGFTNEDETLATTFAGQAAIAIQNARLFESQDQQLMERVQELEGMAAVDSTLNQTLFLDQLSDAIMKWAFDRTGVRYGAMLLMEPDRQSLRLVRAYGYPEGSRFYSDDKAEQQPIFIAPNTGVWGRAISSRSAAMLTDVKLDPTYVETLPRSKAQIAVPLVSGSEVNGVILVETDQDGQLSLLDMDFLQRLADRASTAISNALLFLQLEQEQKRRAEFVSEIAHELKNAISPMKGYAGLLARGMAGDLTDQQRQFLQRLNVNIEHMDMLVQDMRDAEAKELTITPDTVNFREVLEESLSFVEDDFEEREQEVILKVQDDLPDIWADRTRIKQILINFLTNANKYTPEEGEITVTAEAVANEWDSEGVARVLHVAIQDTGLGISEADLKRLFEKYFRSSNEQALKQKGTGLGLSLTRRLIEGHGGKIWVESTLGEGTTFHFTIPLASEIAGAAG